MDVSTYSVVLFVHIAVVIVALSMAAVLHTALLMLRQATTTQVVRPWMPVIRALEPLLPLAALVLVGTGAWLIQISDGEFAWGDGWVVTSIVTLVVAEGLGAFIGPRSAALQAAVRESGDGPVTADLHRRATDPVIWLTAHVNTAAFFGVVFLMTAKPSTAWSAAVVVIAALLGAASALPFIARRPTTGRSARPAGSA